MVAHFALTITGVVLAAGLSRRMGRPKLLIPLAGRPVVLMALKAFQESRLDDLLVVANGDTAELLRGGYRGTRARIIVNPRPEDGLATSLKLAIGALKSEAAVVGLGDQPLLLPSTIDAMIAEHKSSGASIVVPVRDGRRGNPVLFGRAHFSEIMAMDGDVGARQVVLRNSDAVREVEVDDEGIFMDIDTPEDLDRAGEILAERRKVAARRTRIQGGGARSPRRPREGRPSPREPPRTHSHE